MKGFYVAENQTRSLPDGLSMSIFTDFKFSVIRVHYEDTQLTYYFIVIENVFAGYVVGP